MNKVGRQRLTITLRSDVLGQLDAIIDGEKIRNRSHAIEYILSQNLGPKIKRAVILAGGHGVKMRPFTYEMPKTMIPVRGKPILQYIIESLRDVGLTQITIVIGRPLGENIQKYFHDGAQYGVSITYVTESKNAGTAGALRPLNKVIHEPFLLYYGDVLADIDIRELMEFHKEHAPVVSAALTATDHYSDYGVVKLKGHTIVDFVEKPTDKEYLGLVSAGIFVVEPTIFDYLPDKQPASLEEDVLPKLIKTKKLNGYPFSGRWYDISTPEIYEHVLKEWTK
ncbi:MAG: sugar phosphate nucleotidyltransferase [Patescibacteria group bacterium]|jgi:NDP-sugar pyrophosphorylase family protein